MRILIVVHGYPPTYTGGAELRAERTARGLAALGHKLAVVCIESIATPYSQFVYQDQMQSGVYVRRLSFRFQPGMEGFRQSYANPQIGEAVAQMIDSFRPDVIHFFSGYLMGVSVIHTAVALGVPIVVSLTDYWWLCHRVNFVRINGTRCEGPTPVDCARCYCEIYRRFRLPTQVARPLANGLWELVRRVPSLSESLGLAQQVERLKTTLHALGKADKLIAPSQYLANTYISHGIAPALIGVWRQGVNLTVCPLRKPSPTLRFGYLGQIKEHKGVHLLVEAWGMLKGRRPRSLVIYGSPQGAEAYGEELQRRSQQMADLQWARPLDHHDVWPALAELDVLVIPSRWRENSPNVILEAQAMGVAVIGANLGGVAELVRHEGNGLTFAVDSAADLAAQLQRMLDEPELLPRLRRNLLPFRSFADELAQLDALYGELVSGRSLPAAFRAQAVEQGV